MRLALVAVLVAAAANAADCPPIPIDALEKRDLNQAVRQRLLTTYRAACEEPSKMGELGMLLHAHEEFAWAQACYRAAPASPRWRYLLGHVSRQLGDMEAAKAALADLSNAAAQTELGHILRDAGRAEEAQQAYRKALELRPDSVEALYGLGEFEQAAELAPNYAQAWYALAQAHRREGRPTEADRALEAYRRVAPLGWRPPNPLLEEVRALYSGPAGRIASGIAAARQGDLEAARAEFEAAAAADPRSPVPHSNLITLFAELERFRDAENHYRSALRINPDWADAHAGWGAALARQGRLAEAVKVLERARDINPYHADYRVQLGLAYSDLDRSNDARREFRAALEANPLHPMAKRLLEAASDAVE